MSNLQTYYNFKLDLNKKKSGPTHRRQVVNPRHQTPQGQSVAKPGTTRFHSKDIHLAMIQTNQRCVPS